MNYPSIGTVIAISFWWGEHLAIVAYRNGRWTLISNRANRGCVTEEPWEQVVGARAWRLVEYRSSLPRDEIIARARSKIGTRYSFWTWNCEDFVLWAHGIAAASPQRERALTVVSVAVLAFAVSSR